MFFTYLDELHTADILVQPSSGFLGKITAWFLGTEWVHVGMVADERQVIDCYPFKGKRLTPVSEWCGSYVLRVRDDAVAVKAAAIAAELPVRNYSIFNGIMAVWFPSTNDSLHNYRLYNCSSFVSACYRFAGLDLLPGRADKSSLPHHFFDAEALQFAGCLADKDSPRTDCRG